MTFLFDAILVLLFVLCVWLGWHRGFIRTISGLIALVAAVVLSSLLSGPIAGGIYDSAIEPALTQTLSEHIQSEALPTAEQIDEALEEMPGMVQALLRAEGMDSGEAVLEQLDVAAIGDSAAHSIEEKVLAPIVCGLLTLLCSVLLFLLAYGLASFLLRILNVVAKLPLLKQANGVLGIVAGGLSGLLWVLFAAEVLQTVAGLGVFSWLTPAMLEDTWVVSLIGSLSPAVGA